MTERNRPSSDPPSERQETESGPSSSVTDLLAAQKRGDADALAELIPLVYDELRRIARSHMSHEMGGHTLQPTALVHEACLRLLRRPLAIEDRLHFLAIASRVMRQVLVDHAVRRRAVRRGGGRERVGLDETLALFEESCSDILVLDEALRDLAALDPLQCQIVELRFFGGLSMAEISEAVRVPLRTTEREWAMARAWLRRRLSTPRE